MISRRAFVAGLTASLLAAPLAAQGQQSPSMPGVGFLSPSSLSDQRTRRYFEAFKQGLHELGYVEGQNIAIETSWAEGKYDKVPGLASELVRGNVNVIVTYGTAIRSVQQTTGTTPIVAAVMQDPVAGGFIASLARPGRNVTGVSTMIPEMIGKQLEILKGAVPKVSRVTVLSNPDNTSKPKMGPANATAQTLGIQLDPVDARSSGEIDAAFATITARRADAIIVLPDAVLFDNRARIADLAIRYRLPTVSLNRDQVQAGMLITYGPSIEEAFRRAAYFVDKILKGARPADLPVEQPIKFELAINLKTAKAIGLTIPPSLLARADQVIE